MSELAPTKTTTIKTSNGELYAEEFVPAGGAKGVVLVTHGYMEHCGRYRELARVIVDAGWACLTYDVRGHGKSPGDRGFIASFGEFLADFRAAHAAAKKLAPGKPIVLLGHSHGSLITLRALSSESPPDAVHAIVSSPYLAPKYAVPSWQRLLARVASRLVPKLTQPSPLRSEDLTHDAAKIAAHKADKLLFDKLPVRWFTEATKAQAYVEAHANRIKIPTTWLVAAADPVCDASVSKRVAARVPGAHYIDLAGMFHEVFNEVDRAKPFGEVTKVLAECAAAST